jgi:hypothetical protein
MGKGQAEGKGQAAIMGSAAFPSGVITSLARKSVMIIIFWHAHSARSS